jgi:ribosome biogenesis GTPase A
MTKARRLIAESVSAQDVIIEVIDARMPGSSSNPIVTELRGRKPCLKVLSKMDLADPNVTQAWLRHIEAEAPPETQEIGRVLTMAWNANRPGEAKAKIPELCRKLLRRADNAGRTVRVMIVGIPNVGKSTLINTLMERKVAKVGDEPAVTKNQQHVVLKNGLTLLDNPGILWPKIEDPDAALRLAFGGAIPDTAIDFETVALFGAGLLRERYPQLLMARYKMAELPPTGDEVILEIGRRRGCLRPGGVIDRHKASDILVHDFRAGALGRISLEVPEDLVLFRQRDAERKAAEAEKLRLAEERAKEERAQDDLRRTEERRQRVAQRQAQEAEGGEGGEEELIDGDWRDG